MSSIAVSNLYKVDGIVAVVTGGGTGIGLMIARALALNNAHKAYIVGRRKEPLENAASTVPRGTEVKSEVGYINLLVANSGIYGPSPEIRQDMTPSEIWDIVKACPQDEFTKPFNVNVTGVYYSAMAFLPLLDEGNKKGNLPATVKSYIIVASSIAGLSRLIGTGYAYHSIKAAVTHLVKILATFLVPYDLRVNAIAPGLFPSEITAAGVGPFQGGL